MKPTHFVSLRVNISGDYDQDQAKCAADELAISLMGLDFVCNASWDEIEDLRP